MKKICTKCKDEKELEEFNKNKNKKDGHHNMCRECMREHSKEYYKKNKHQMTKKINELRRKRVDVLRKYVFDYKSKNPCIDCDESNPIVLQFDHFGDKENNVSTLIRQAVPLKKLKEEITKCDVRCANCHAIKTAKEFNWYGEFI